MMNRKCAGRWTVAFLLATLAVIGGSALLPAMAMPKPEPGPTDTASSSAQIRAHIVAVTRWQLTHSRPYKVHGKIYNSSPNLKGHYNYLGRNGSNENRNIYTGYRSESWCGDFVRFVWTSGGTVSAPSGRVSGTHNVGEARTAHRATPYCRLSLVVSHPELTTSVYHLQMPAGLMSWP
jgi:hypothetical protein